MVPRAAPRRDGALGPTHEERRSVIRPGTGGATKIGECQKVCSDRWARLANNDTW
jgi:hypothetical protein